MIARPSRRRLAIITIVAAAGFLAFFFLAPVFYWYAAYSPLITFSGNDVIYTVYRSLGCQYLGLGDAYYTTSITINSAPSIDSVVFSCAQPLLPL